MQEHGTSSPRAVPVPCKQPSADEAAGWTRDQASAAKSEALAKAQRPPVPAESSRWARAPSTAFLQPCCGACPGLDTPAALHRGGLAAVAHRSVAVLSTQPWVACWTAHSHLAGLSSGPAGAGWPATLQTCKLQLPGGPCAAGVFSLGTGTTARPLQQGSSTVPSCSGGLPALSGQRCCRAACHICQA